MSDWPCDTGDCYADAHGGCHQPCPVNGGASDTEREVIDQLATTGTWVTRDGDGVLRHWNGITYEYVEVTDA